jgi:Family of unknown function (DUF5706)
MDSPKQQPQPAHPLKKRARVDAAAQMAPILSSWEIPKEHLPEIVQATQRSLETVTHLTEYEDDKANRILTAMAFMSAFAAVIFAVVPSRYPLSMPLILAGKGFRWEAFLLFVAYGAFVVYALALTMGVVCVLHAVRPRFNVSKTWKPDGSKPGSLLFFDKIIDVSPADWANEFANSDKDGLLSTFARNSILETYLIAEKIAFKMKWLTCGVRLFFVSTIVLAILLPLVVATLALVPEKPEQPQQSNQQHAVSLGGGGANAQAPVKRQKLDLGRQATINRTPSGTIQ